jgi:hypothetical protein
MQKFEIKHRYTGALLYEAEAEGLSDAVVRAVANRADLRSANLRSADLRSANLRSADLSFADLRSANLRFADLRSADLRFADLRSADLSFADLRSADLSFADLSFADLRSADLSSANLTSPTAVLLAMWGDLSQQLCADLMLFDADNHPDKTAFDHWAAGGSCPYSDVHVQRAANFSERKELWGKGQPCRPYDLMTRVLAECCPDWSDEQRDEFEKRFEAR